jgi:hypothetical protein
VSDADTAAETVAVTVYVTVADVAATLERAKLVMNENGYDDPAPTLEQAVADIVNMDGENNYLAFFVTLRDSNGSLGGWSAEPAMIDGCNIPDCDHRRSNRGYDMQQIDGGGS